MLAETTSNLVVAGVVAAVMAAYKGLEFGITTINGRNSGTKHTRAIERDVAMCRQHDERISAVEQYGERLAKLETTVEHVHDTVKAGFMRIEKKLNDG